MSEPAHALADAPSMLIAGRWEAPAGGTRIPRVDPATEDPRAPVIPASPDQVARAVAAAAGSGWQAASRDDRLAALDRLGAALAARAEALAQVISAEIGAPIDFARSGQVAAALGHLTATRDALAAAPDDTHAPGQPDHRVRYEPAGVAALITPWNWPLNQVALKVGAALAAGCPMVLKPSELGADTAAVFADAMQDADLPPGTFNLLQGGADVGAALVADPRVAVISFTGSTRAGQSIASAAAIGFRRTVLELGGKSPNVVFADCDLDRAIRQGLAHCFRNNGQSCNAAARMLVERSVYEDAVALAADLAAAWPVDAPGRSGAHLGPQVSAVQFAHVQDLIDSGVAQGARLVAGGRGRAPGFTRGFYSRPTVFADMTPAMRVWREEIFGPVLTMTPFEDEAHAIALANDSAYGLAGYVQTGDSARADRVARALRVGMVQINGQSRIAGAPFGGVKGSGMGREAGLWGIRAFQDIKSISGAALV
ncbi:aldehyde dehydrogenase family protein [Meridianimarinicoccus sp. RP-17]|uniref:aldehyde dehydrogenase family protein n=1 Tax=Meridianimarinicoccus zhengii TaxID=2056810 RepID=UPI000DADD309|nr:aldehyde dehydrogenase family protein [Phycocomes zhengii]